MRIISLANPVNVDGRLIQPNTKYLWPGNGDKLKENNVLTKSNTSASKHLRMYKGQASIKGKDVLVIRHGGHGDVIMISPILRHLKEQGAFVTFATRNKYFETCRCVPSIDRYVDTPIRFDELRRFNYHLHFESILQKSRSTKHATELFCKSCNIALNNMQPDFVIPEKYKNDGYFFLHKELNVKKPVVVLHTEASSINRTWPIEYIDELVTMLIDSGYFVVTIGHAKYRRKNNKENFVSLNQRVKDIILNYSLIAASDYFIGPDSVFLHVAGALGVKAVGLFGPFPASARISFYSSVKTIQGKCKQAPCFKHDYKLCNWSLGKNADCMRSIKPAKVLEVLESI